MRRNLLPLLLSGSLVLPALAAVAQERTGPKLAPPAKAKKSPPPPKTAPATTKPAPPPAPEPGQGAPPPAPGAAPRVGDLPGEREFNQCLKLPPGKKTKLTLKPDTDLNDLLAWISGLTCTQFIVPSTIRQQKVTIISPVPITAAEAYRLFLAALESVQLTVVPVGGFLKIIETAKAKESATTYGPDEAAPSDSRFITRLVTVKHADLEAVKNLFNTLRTQQGGDVQSYAPARTLIITDSAANIRRMLEILGELDQEGSAEKIWQIKLRHTGVQEIAAMVGEILGVSTSSGAARRPGVPAPPPMPPKAPVPGHPVSAEPVSRIITDERTNSLIVIASESNYARIRALVLRLDKPVETIEGPEARVHIYPLENADVDELSGTLQGVTGINVSRSQGTRRGLSGSVPAPPPMPAAPAAPARPGEQSLFSGDVSIAADRATNSLVIIASQSDYLTLSKIIKKLDVARRQVLVEATIMEVSMDKTRDLGLSFHGGATLGSGSDQSLLFFGSNPQKTLSPQTGILTDPVALMGLAAGVFGPEIQGADQILNLPGVSIPSFGAFIMALQRNNDVNVLSTPFITTSDNEEAEITVGQNIPFQGAFVGGLGGLPGGAGAGGLLPSVSVQRQDVALRLKLKPHVNEGGFVRLEIDQEISDIASPNFNGLGPSTSKRTAKTMVTVKDQQTIVIGGLVSDRTLDRVSKIPLLGDIPILGYLFKQTTKTVEKRNLLIILTPYVVNDQNDLRRIVERKLRDRREFLERYSAFEDRRDFEAQIDYSRKRGLLEEINVASRELDDENLVLEKAAVQMHQEAEQSPIDLPSGAVEGSSRRRGTTAPAPAATPPPKVTPAPVTKPRVLK